MALARALVPVAAPPYCARRRSRSRPRACPGFRRVRSARARAPLVSARLCSDCALACFLLRFLRRPAAVLRSGLFFLFLLLSLFSAAARAFSHIHVHAHVQYLFFRCQAAGFYRYTTCSIGMQRGSLDVMIVTCMFGVGTLKVLLID